MIILGIDPGIATTGIGIVETNGSKHRLVYCGAIVTEAGLPLSERLFQLYDDLSQVLRRYQPNVLAVEELFFNTNAKTALIVGQARGVILLCGRQSQLPVFGYTPPQVKSAVCGYGQADKAQVQYMVKKLLSISQTPKPDDVADALALAICHAHSHRVKSLS